MQALIDFIVRNLLEFWPVARVYSYQQGLRLRGGHVRDELTPGLHFRIPFLDEVKTWPSVEVGLKLDDGELTTSDGFAVHLSANITYRLVSIHTMYSTVWSVETSLRLLALGCIMTQCSQYTWPDLKSDRLKVEAKLLESLREAVASWGCTIERVNITELALPRQYLLGAA